MALSAGVFALWVSGSEENFSNLQVASVCLCKKKSVTGVLLRQRAAVLTVSGVTPPLPVEKPASSTR
jgi:hypothetical protein